MAQGYLQVDVVSDTNNFPITDASISISKTETPEEILEESYRYSSCITLFMGVTFAYNLGAGILRAVGNSLMPLVFLIVSSVLNIGLDLWFITGLGMGVRGAAVATVLAQGVSVILCVLYILKSVRILIPSKHVSGNAGAGRLDGLDELPRVRGHGDPSDWNQRPWLSGDCGSYVGTEAVFIFPDAADGDGGIS